MSPSEHSSVARASQLFATTQWSAVLTAGEDSSPSTTLALEQLCRTYWYPLYAYVRRRGHTVEDAQDLTQEFFSRLLERKYLKLADRTRGRFRSFLLTSLKHFLINEWNKANALKRGGGERIFSLDEETTAEERYAAEPTVEQPPDSLYDKGWANTLLKQALTGLGEECTNNGKAASLEELKAFVWGGQEPQSYAVVAARLGMTESALRVAVHRLRQRFGELLRMEVARTVSTAAEVEEELRYLISVVRGT